MVQALLMLEILFTQGSWVEYSYLFRGAYSSSDPVCSSAIISSAWGLSLFKITFSMTLLEWSMMLMVLLFWQSCKLPCLREYNNQRLSPWGRPFSYSPDGLITDLC